MKNNEVSIQKLKVAEDNAGMAIAFLHGIIHDKGGDAGQELMRNKMAEIANLVDLMPEEKRNEQMSIWSAELNEENMRGWIAEDDIETLSFNVGKMAALVFFLKEHRLELEKTMNKMNKKNTAAAKKKKVKIAKASRAKNR